MKCSDPNAGEHSCGDRGILPDKDKAGAGGGGSGHGHRKYGGGRPVDAPLQLF